LPVEGSDQQKRTNEIGMAIPLLDTCDLVGRDITGDALLTQRALATYIVERQAHYHFTAKGNQPALERDIALLFEARSTPDFVDVTPPEHGRIETRRCWMTTVIRSLPDADKWAALSSAACVESVRLIDGKEQRERRYFISSVGVPDAQRMLERIRGHWGVENGLHWCLDVSFDEDRRRIRKGHGAENFSRLSRIALNLLKRERNQKVGIKSKRLLCGWDHPYLFKVLTGGE
jgi:predicted transposase YbfD/YdcC